jgi:hypothetical protein
MTLVCVEGKHLQQMEIQAWLMTLIMTNATGINLQFTRDATYRYKMMQAMRSHACTFAT